MAKRIVNLPGRSAQAGGPGTPFRFTLPDVRNLNRALMLAPDSPAGLSVVCIVEVHRAPMFEKIEVKSALELANRLWEHDGGGA